MIINILSDFYVNYNILHTEICMIIYNTILTRIRIMAFIVSVLGNHITSRCMLIT